MNVDDYVWKQHNVVWFTKVKHALSWWGMIYHGETCFIMVRHDLPWWRIVLLLFTCQCEQEKRNHLDILRTNTCLSSNYKHYASRWLLHKIHQFSSHKSSLISGWSSCDGRRCCRMARMFNEMQQQRCNCQNAKRSGNQIILLLKTIYCYVFLLSFLYLWTLVQAFLVKIYCFIVIGIK